MNQPFGLSRARGATRLFVWALASAILLAACNGGGDSAPILGALSVPASPASLIRTGNGFDLRVVNPGTVNAQIYVAQSGQQGVASSVYDYHAPNKKDEKWFCHIRNVRHSGVYAIEVDRKGELWIPLGSRIISHAPNCGAVGTTLSDPSQTANDIAFDSKGTRYVSNNYDVDRGDVSVYPRGAISPTRELKSSAVYFSNGVAVDSHDNVYESFTNASSNGGGVVEYKGGRRPGKVLKTIMLGLPGPPMFDKNDNLIITDDNYPSTDSTVKEYAPPYEKAPAIFVTEGISNQCSLNRVETNIACADSSLFTIDVYKYPAGTYLYSFSNGVMPPARTLGVAQDPRE